MPTSSLAHHPPVGLGDYGFGVAGVFMLCAGG
jgi:hypothetical protein